MRFKEIINENLRKWFKEKWVRFGPDGKIRGDCARGDDSEGKPKCLPQSKAHALGKKGRASAARRKRREDPNPERRGKAINVATKKKTNEGDVIPFGRKPAPALRWQDVPPDVLHLASEWFWADDESMSFDAAMDPQGLGNSIENEIKYIRAKLQQRGWTIDHHDDESGEHNLILTNRQGQSVLLPVEDAQSFRGWAQGTNPMREAQLDELKCWDGYRRVPGKRPGSPGSCTPATAESLDGVSQGTHMFTSEENTPARKGTISSFGTAGRVGILNKERILKADSFVTKQANHPQNQAKLYVPDAGSPKGIREVAVLNTADTKLLAQFLQAFFRNPELNRAHKWLYDFLSEPGKVQQLANQISRQPKYLEFIQQVKDPAHIRSFIAALDSIRPEITEKWSAKYKRSINCSNPKGFSQRAHCQGRRKK